MKFILLLIISLLSLFSCIPRKSTYVIDEDKIKKEVSEIIGHQPLKKENISQVEILKRQEEFISNYFNNKKNLKADAMHLLGDLYLKMEKNNLLAISLDPDNQRSAEIYEKILSLYPDRPENDSILYQLSSIYCEKRDTDKCIDLLFKLREKYPQSIYVLEANFRLGEIFFESGQFHNASTFYQESIKKEDPFFYERALYKLGLSYFNLQEYKKVIDIFLSLIDRKRIDVEYEKRFDIKALPESDRELVSDVINITTLAFSYIGEPSNIDKYLEETEHKDYEIVIYKKLAEYYINEKNIYDAISVYKNFIESYPLHEESSLFQAKIIELYDREDYIHMANKARIRLIDDYNRESDWYKNNNANSRRKINPIVKKNLKELALYFHSQAQASNYIEDYNNAVNWYKKFLRYFPSERDSSEINFLLAEALYEIEEYKDAAIEYEKTAYEYQTHNRAKDAAYSAIFSLKKVLDEGGIDDFEVDLYTEKFIKNCERFALLFPDDSRTPDIVMKAGEILFERENYEDFRRFVSRVIDRYADTDPSNPIIYKLQSLIADSLFKEKEYTKAEEEYRKAKVFIKTEDRDEASEIDRLLASSIYKEAERLREDGKTDKAVEEFIKVYREVPSTEIATIALYDAGLLALNNSDTDGAVDIFTILLQEYPLSEYIQKIPKVIIKTGDILFYSGKYDKVREFAQKVMDMYRNTHYSDHFMYNMQRLIADSLFKEKEYIRAGEEYRKARVFIKTEEQKMTSEIDRLLASSIYKEAEKLKKNGMTDEAIKEFIKVYKEVPSTDIAPIALYDAGLLALNTGDTDRTIDTFNLLNKHYPYSEYTYKVTIKLAEIYEKEGELNKAASIYQRLSLLSEDEDEASDAIFMAGLLYEKALNWDKVYTTFKIYIDNYGDNYEKVVEAMFKRANAKLKLNNQREARRIFQLIVELYGGGIYNSSKLNYLLARSYFIIGEYLFDEYKEIRLNSPLEENLEKKNDLLEKVLDYYSHAEEYNIAEITTESTYKTAMAFEDFRDALLKSERPSELTIDQLDEYNAILEEEAYPYQKKAIAAYKSNIRLTHEFGLYDDWIKKSYSSLSKIFPIRYQKKELTEIVSTNLSF